MAKSFEQFPEESNPQEQTSRVEDPFIESLKTHGGREIGELGWEDLLDKQDIAARKSPTIEKHKKDIVASLQKERTKTPEEIEKERIEKLREETGYAGALEKLRVEKIETFKAMETLGKRFPWVFLKGKKIEKMGKLSAQLKALGAAENIITYRIRKISLHEIHTWNEDLAKKINNLAGKIAMDVYDAIHTDPESVERIENIVEKDMRRQEVLYEEFQRRNEAHRGDE